MRPSSSPSQMIQHIIEAGYEDYLQENFANYRQRLEDLEQLASFARTFLSTEEFLTQLSLLTNIEAEEQDTKSKDDEQVRLSTIHQAKGLEFDVVFVIMLCDGLFPSSRSAESPDGEEEERQQHHQPVRIDQGQQPGPDRRPDGVPLWLRGDATLLARSGVAIVGARNASAARCAPISPPYTRRCRAI